MTGTSDAGHAYLEYCNDHPEFYREVRAVLDKIRKVLTEKYKITKCLDFDIDLSQCEGHEENEAAL